MLSQEIRTLDDILGSLRLLLDRMGAVLPASADEVSSLVTQALDAISVIRERTRAVAAEVGTAAVWSDRTEFDALLAGLANALATQDVDRTRGFLRDLAATVESHVVVHRSAQSADQRNRTRLQAVDEISQAAARHMPPAIPGPTSASAWLPWAWMLAGDPLSHLDAALLHAGLPALAELVREVEPTWWQASARIPDPEPPKVEPEPTRIVAQFVPEPSAIESPPEPMLVVAESTPPAEPEQVQIVVERQPESALVIELPALIQPELASLVVEPAPKSTSIEPPPQPSTDQPPPLTVVAAPELRPTLPEPRSPSVPAPVAAPRSMAPAPPAVSRLDLRTGLIASDVVEDFDRRRFASTTARSFAVSLSGATGPTEAWATLAWALVEERRFAEAYWLSAAMQSVPEVAVIAPIPQIVEALAFCETRISQDGPSATRLQDLYIQLDYNRLVDLDGVLSADAWLALSASLRPALMAPFCGALELLGMLEGRLDGAAGQIVRLVVEHARRGQPLVPDRMRDYAGWESELAELRQRADTWSARASTRTVNYAPATDIWRQWQRAGGTIHGLLAPVRMGDVTRRDFVSTEIERLSTQGRFIAQVDATRREKRIPNPIIARALDQLGHFTDEAIDLARDWLRLLDAEPQVDADRERLERLRAELARLQPAIAQQLAALGAADRSISVARAVVATALEGVISLLAGQAGGLGEEVDRRRLLGPSLLITGATDDDHLEMAACAIIESVARPPTWLEVFQSQLDRRNLAAARAVLEAGVHAVATDAEKRQMSQRLDASVAECKQELKDAIERTQRAVEEAVLNDVVAEDERLRLGHRVEMIGRQDTVSFAEPLAVLDGLRRNLDQRTQRRADECREELGKLQGVDPATRQRIERALDARELSAAFELVALIREKRSLPGEDSARGHLAAFFPAAERQITQFLETNPPPVLVRTVRVGRPLPWVDLPLDGDRARDACLALESWYELKRRGRPAQPAEISPRIAQLLKWIGFDASVAVMRTRSNRCWFDVSAAIPKNCPVPRFGSITEGKYRLLVTWEQPADDRLLEWVEQDAKDSAVLVFHFGRIAEQGRRDLAKRSRSVHRSPIIIDDKLLVFLAGEREGRLNALFECALPFAFTNPYMPYAAGNVPPEIFFGRSRELREVTDQFGSCFIYGGRQLGKSALLRAAERHFTVASIGHFAFYIDLKSEGIPEQRPPSDLWSLVAQQLRERGIVDAKKTNLQAEGVVGEIRAWLNTAGDRRLLLLLDEADSLLDHDASAAGKFAIVGRLKNLMESTNRRFKVVFAGLHNVQRFVSIPNQPLAHFGNPISIGPLEPRFALELVERPLRALGFELKSRDLALRIVSHSNYQPSLIQLFCHELVEHLSRTARFDVRTTPPCEVTGEHIDEIYRSQDLRARIRERFEWTLNLDTRYRVLAYTAAHLTLESPPSFPEGITFRELGDQARGFWRRGFDGTSADELRGLVDEMVGLGLFAADAGRYRLRSPNVLRLLGSADQIVDQLMQMEDIAPPPAFEPGSHRRPLDPSHVQRSPLTLADEADLLKEGGKVRLLFGSDALGLGALDRGLSLMSDAHTKVLPLEAALIVRPEELLGRIPEDAARVILWGRFDELPGAPEARRAAIEVLATRLARRKKQTVTVVVAMGPAEARSWMTLEPGPRLETEKLAPTMCLKRWSHSMIRRWAEDANVSPNAFDHQAIYERTAGWPLLTEELGDKAVKKTQRLLESIDSLDVDVSRAFAASIRIDDLPELALLAELLKPGETIGIEEACMFLEVEADAAEAWLSLGERQQLLVRDADRWRVEGVALHLLHRAAAHYL